MATLIPALGTCLHRMTSDEQRLAERLEHKLDDNFWLWYDLPIDSKPTHPDFVVQHRRAQRKPEPRRFGDGIEIGLCGGDEINYTTNAY